MTTTYTWSVLSMSTLPLVDGETDVVVNAQWLLTGIDGETSAAIGGNSQFVLEQGGGFTPYADLTEAEVIGWIQSGLGESGVYSMEMCVQGQINSILNPPVSPEAQPLPW